MGVILYILLVKIRDLTLNERPKAIKRLLSLDPKSTDVVIFKPSGYLIEETSNLQARTSSVWNPEWRFQLLSNVKYVKWRRQLQSLNSSQEMKLATTTIVSTPETPNNIHRMLILFETAAGFAVFKLLDESKLTASEETLAECFKTLPGAKQIVELVAFQNYSELKDAVESTLALSQGNLPVTIHKLLAKLDLSEEEKEETILVGDYELGQSIEKAFQVPYLCNRHVLNIMRCIRTQIDGLLNMPLFLQDEMKLMTFVLAQSTGMQKIQDNPNLVDTHVKFNVKLHDDLESSIPLTIAKIKSKYSDHFPELSFILKDDDMAYIQVVQILGHRDNVDEVDLSCILSKELEEQVEKAAETSIGDDFLKEEDFKQIQRDCDNVIEDFNYMTESEEYLESRMSALAPNVTALVGSLIAARLISKAGTLINLSKKPAATISLLGAEKALFASLKKNHSTPRHGCIFKSSFVQNAHGKIKGKASRVLACKIALAARIDSFSELDSTEPAKSYKTQVESRIQRLNEEVQFSLEKAEKARIAESKLEQVVNGHSDENFNIVIGNSRKRKCTSFGIPDDVVPNKKIKFMDAMEVVKTI